ncbi:uncharacterized protein ACR2FA_001743 [Aphomia sociella]
MNDLTPLQANMGDVIHLSRQNMNLNNDHYLVPVLKADAEHSGQVEILIDSTPENNLLSYTDRPTLNQIPLNNHSQTTNKDTIQESNTQLSNEITESSIEYNDITKLERPTIYNNTVSVETGNGHQRENQKILQNYVHIPDRVAPSRAEAVLPAALQLRRDGSVCTRRSVLAPTRFGPVTGVNHGVSEEVTRELISQAADLKRPVFLIKNNGITTHIDVSDKDKSNWLSLLSLGDQSNANVWLYQEDNELYAITTKTLEARSILYLGYSEQYVKEHNLPPNQPVIDLSEALSKDPKIWWCNECHSAQESAVQLRQHVNVCHKKKKFKKRFNRYRCQHCTRTFSRLFTLRRHVRTNCRKKINISEIAIESEAIPDVGSNMTHFLTFHQNNKTEESLLSSCPYCNIAMSKGMKSQHVRQCPALRFECECGSVFFNKEKLANHIYSNHPFKVNTSKEEDHRNLKDDTDSNNMPYKCEQCQHVFKRRGMLVNHLWRAHRAGAAAATAALPLARHERCFPCGACPKLYRSRAKRDRHVRVHHPGIELDRVQSIIGGKKAYEPAACIACPRQYATRAKLLQHIRAHHPHLAPPKKKSLKKTKGVLEEF